MSTENAVSDAPQTTSGQPENSQDKVAYDTYRRVLSEAKKLKDELMLIKEQEQKSHETKLKEQNEWKLLAENYQKQLEQTKSILTEQEQSIVNGMKYQEFEKHLGGKLKDKDYATFIEFDKIVMNPETKRVDEDSVKGVVSSFVKKHSHLVEFMNGARVPNEAPRSTQHFNGSKPLESMSAKELEEFIKAQDRAGLLK